MARKRKTRDEWEVQGFYAGNWEMVTAADTLKEIRQYLKEYRENEPHTAFRTKKLRVRIETEATA